LYLATTKGKYNIKEATEIHPTCKCTLIGEATAFEAVYSIYSSSILCHTEGKL